jgi:hypothetical protein
MQKLIIATMAAVTLLATRLEVSAQELVEPLELTAQALVEPADTGRAKVLVGVPFFGCGRSGTLQGLTTAVRYALPVILSHLVRCWPHSSKGPPSSRTWA